MKPAVNPSERRAFGRRESLIEAVVTVGGRHSQTCILRNVSEHGALVEFASGVPAVATFRVRVETMQAEALCEVRHRNGNEAGVRFVGGNLADVLQRHAARQAEAGDATAVERATRPAAPVKATTGGDIRRLLHVNNVQPAIANSR